MAKEDDAAAAAAVAAAAEAAVLDANRRGWLLAAEAEIQAVRAHFVAGVYRAEKLVATPVDLALSDGFWRVARSPWRFLVAEGHVVEMARDDALPKGDLAPEPENSVPAE